MITKPKYIQFIFFIILFSPLISNSQNVLNGMVEDIEDIPVFAANVYLKSVIQKGTTTNFDGKFGLEIPNAKSDTLVISYIGFETKQIPLSEINLDKLLIVKLTAQSDKLDEVIVKYADPISEQFSLVKMDMFRDVYLNPSAQGDPLKAITNLPSSTNSDETANVELRGSSADRSRVVLNGVPVHNPVRLSSLNNQGFFSLFNPEVIEKQYVYASNPPLTFGNTSAGLVEIETEKNLTNNQLQLSTALASTGFFLSQNLKTNKSFVQIYGNYQFSDVFVKIQEEQLPQVKSFNVKDIGINLNSKIGKKTEFNSFSYFINENFNGISERYTYKGKTKTNRKRFFTINNLKIYAKKGVWQINSGVSTDKSNYQFGNISSDNNYKNFFSSINYKWFFSNNTDIKFGISHEYHNHIFNDTVSTYYYALSPESPNAFSKKDITNHILEAYAYILWDINDRLSFSSGMRSNIPINNQNHYFSSQISFIVKPNKKNRFLLSGGKYHSYNTPNYYAKSYNLLKSHQIALDYNFQHKNIVLKAASYFKNEKGEQSDSNFFEISKTNTLGVELFVEKSFLKYFKVTLSNSFINQNITIDDNKYPGSNDFDYLLKAALQYNNSNLFSIALLYQSRPGAYYIPIIDAILNPEVEFYEPNFSNNLYSQQFSNYSRFDLSLSKYIPLKNDALIFFASVNNIFNRKNEQMIQYNVNYTEKSFDYYQLRNIYFGLVWQLDYR